MRALIDHPDEIDEQVYRAFVRDAQLEGLMADYLVQGESYLALNAIILDRQDAVQLEKVTETFTRALVRAGRIVAADVPLLVDMGFPWVAAELLSAEPPRVPLIGRFDFAQDRAGHWWVLELNADTPSGIRETAVVDRLVHEALPAARTLRRPSEPFEGVLCQAILAGCASVGAGEALGLLTNAGEMEDLAQIAFVGRLVERPLRERGVGVVLADLDNVSAPHGALALCGQPVAALYRGAPYEAMFGGRAFAAIYGAVARGRVQLLNGLFGLLLQHKGLLAWLWDHRADPRFPADEQLAVAHHLPPTWMIGCTPSGWPREDLVAKQVFGREGEEIFFGDEVDAPTWDVLRRRRTYVAQQRIDVCQFDAVVPAALGPVWQTGRAAVGCFTIDGRAAGFYTRFGGRITTSRAKWLATFVDTAGDGGPTKEGL